MLNLISLKVKIGMDSKLKAQPAESMNINDDEIDLFELWNGLVAEKLTIMASFIITVLLATVYAFNVTPVYQSESYLLPPAAEKVLPMNELAIVLGAGSATHTPSSVFTQFKMNLDSRQTLKAIFNKYHLINTYNPDIDQLSGADKIKSEKVAFAEFIKDFSIKSAKAKDFSNGVSVSLALSLSEQKVADILNELVVVAEQKTLQDIYREILAEKQSRVGLVDVRISSARKIALDKRLDRIAQLDEAIVISRQLGINKPILERDSNSALYLMGSDILVAEKKVLELRKNDDAFISQLRDLQEQRQKLQSVKISKSDFGAVTIDQAAIYGDKIKPKKSLILAVAGVLGLMLGVLIDLIRRDVKNRRQADLTSA
jgi:chain length determinant protein (polysaccharide antigen chain regulator)